MPLKTPPFWYRNTVNKPPLVETLLSTLSPLYQWVHNLNQARKSPYAASIPVICVGNATSGGSGKTPTCQALMRLIQNNNLTNSPCFLTRGYGGSIQGPLRLTPELHSAKETGDEPQILAKTAQTIISTDRVNGIKFIEEQELSACILDDGLQNRSLHKTLSFLVIDGIYGFGNLKTLPAGPLRESLPQAFDKSNAFIMIGEDQRNARTHLPQEKPVFQAHIKPQIPDKLQKDKAVIAFCGLGMPEKFFTMLIDLGFNLINTHSFADHHPYSLQDLEKLQQEAAKHNAQLVTTEKDMMRIPAGHDIAHIPITLEFENEEQIIQLLKKHL